jgi:hypothetical protein
MGSWLFAAFLGKTPSNCKKILPSLLPEASISIMKKRFRALTFRQGLVMAGNYLFLLLFLFVATSLNAAKTKKAGGLKVRAFV